MGVTVDTSELDEAADNLLRMWTASSAVETVEILAEEWVKVSKAAAPVDTGQLRARIAIASIGGTAARAEAEIVSDVPYAGYVEFGTSRQAPNPYFRAGRDAAEQLARRSGGRVATEIVRVLESGGVWNPRRVFR